MPSPSPSPSSLRSHFRLDAATCYLDAASVTPRATAAGDAARAAIERSETPWRQRDWDKAAAVEQVRALAALAIRATAADIALTSSVSYGMATAAANLAIAPGSRLLVLQDDHPSASLIWARSAAQNQAALDVVPRPADGDWTGAVLAKLHGGPPPAVAVISPVHWTDGSLLDIGRIAPAVRGTGAALVLDATQAAGMIELDAAALDADFVMFPAYKWMMGPYGLAFLYAHPRHQEGCTLEDHMGTRRAPALRRAGDAGDFSYLPGARRFDRGERDDALLLAAAAQGLALCGSVPLAHKQAHLWKLTDRLVAALQATPASTAPRRFRSPHIVGIGTGDLEAADLAAALERHAVYASARRGYLRVSPYLYNDEADIDRFAQVLRSVAHWG